MNRRCRCPTRGWLKKTGPGETIFITMVTTRAIKANTGSASRQQVTSIVRFQPGIGPERLINGAILVIFVLVFLAMGFAADGHDMSGDEGNQSVFSSDKRLAGLAQFRMCGICTGNAMGTMGCNPCAVVALGCFSVAMSRDKA